MICFVSMRSQYAAAQSFPLPLTHNLSITAGAENRKEDFRWSIAGNSAGTDPNILSEIIFNPVHSAGFNIGLSYKPYQGLTIDLEYSKLFTYKGDATDFDYDGDNRTHPSVELFLNSDQGNMRNAEARLYYTLSDKHPFCFQAGAAYSGTKELFYLLNDADPDLRTSYLARWKGPGLSVKASYNFRKINLGSKFDYYFFKYNAEANWNTIDNFQHPISFIQTAKGGGWNYKAQVGWQFNRRTTLNADWIYSNWKSEPGIDRLFLKTGETPETRMNGAFKKNNGWRLSATYSF